MNCCRRLSRRHEVPMPGRVTRNCGFKFLVVRLVISYLLIFVVAFLLVISEWMLHAGLECLAG